MHVVFNHGKESGPWGTKIQALAKVAEELGCTVTSLDYQGEMDVDARVAQLLDYLTSVGEQPVYLVGSSMGGYVATAAAGQVKCGGLLAMAPALYMGGKVNFDELTLNCPACIIHGWRDDIVAVENSWRFAQRHKTDLHLVDDDHRLISSLPETEAIFRRHLIACKESRLQES